MFPPSAFAVRWGGNAVAIHSKWLVAVVAAAALTVALLAPEDAALAQRLGWYASGVILIAALIASLLVHEAGHAVVARWLGGPPLRSCIYPFGSAGVGFKMPSTPGHEIATALAGPVVSFAVAGAAGLAYLALQRAAPMAATTVGWIALVNLGLAAINLLPGYPLDGGRVFRAMVWYLHDDYLTGTRAAVGYAEIISLMGIAGAVFLLGQDSPYPLVGLWALLLAWALNRSSRQELARAVFAVLGSEISVGETVETLNPRIDRRATLEEAVDTLIERSGAGPALVVDEDAVVGVLPLEQLRSVSRAHWRERTVGDVMLPPGSLPAIDRATSLQDLMDTMLDSGSTLMVVVDGGEVVGAVDRRLVIQRLLERARSRRRLRLA